MLLRFRDPRRIQNRPQSVEIKFITSNDDRCTLEHRKFTKQFYRLPLILSLSFNTNLKA